MVEGLFLTALLCGFFAAWHGSRTAYALIGSTALTSSLILIGAPFDFTTWLLIDVAVIVAVELTGRVGTCDRAAFALFPFAFVLYHVQPRGWTDVLTLLVAAQFLLITPWDRLGELTHWKARPA